MDRKGFVAPLILLGILLLLVITGGVYYLGKSRLLVRTPPTISNQTPATPGTFLQTANWGSYTFSKTISLSFPPTVDKPLYVNAGHYAVETKLPGGSVLQIYGADGASPTGGALNFDEMKAALLRNTSFTTSAKTFLGFEAVEFSSMTKQSTMIWGGDAYQKIRGFLINTPTGALVVAHYYPSTPVNPSVPIDFEKDEDIFDQTLSTFKFK